MWRVWITLGFVLSACAQFPDVDAALAENNPDPEIPVLLPFEDLLASDDPRLTKTDDDSLRARAEALRTRAGALRRPVIDRPTRTRMEAGVQQPG